MRRLFLRLYLGIGLVLLLSVAAGIVLERGRAEPWRLNRLIGLPSQVARELSLRDPDARAAALAELGARYDIPVRQVPMEGLRALLGERDRQVLARGEVVIHLEPAGMVYVPSPDRPEGPSMGAGSIAVLGPLPDTPPGRRFGPLVLSLALAGSAAALWFQIRPLERRLAHLSVTAQRFGSGRFSTRAGIGDPDAVGQLARDFDQMAGRVERLMESQKQLVRAVSHELRTPLARLRFGLALVEDAEGPEDRADAVRSMEADLGELESLTAELMDQSRLSAGASALNRRHRPLLPLLERLVADARRLDPRVQVGLSARPVSAEVDERLFRRAVANLLANGVRHADRRLDVKLESSGTRLQVKVTDDGAGVPADQRERIFEPFVRLDAARSRDTGGVGLGLALSRSIARAHGGDLTVGESRRGAAFILELPTPGPGGPSDDPPD